MSASKSWSDVPMNITLICQLEPCTYRDGETIHCGDLAVHYPDTIEEAASTICDLRRWRYASDHRCDGWEITLLLDGREPDSDAEIEIADSINDAAAVLIAEAEALEKQEAERRARAKRIQDEALSKLAAQKRVEADRAKYDELKSRYGW